MQPDFEYSMPLGRPQEQSKNEPESVFAARAEDHFHPEKAEYGRLLLPLAQKGWRKPPAILWRLTLVIGDAVVLILLSLLLFYSKPGLVLFDLRPDMAKSILGTWNVSSIWMLLVLAMWAFASALTQTQQHAASLLKSPLSALCSLVLMLIFSTLFLYLLIGKQVISYAQPLLFFLIMGVPTFILWRAFLSEIVNLPRFRRQAVIVGVNSAGKDIAREILKANHPGTNVLGYIDESTDKPGQADGLPIFGGASALQMLVQGGMVDEIIIAVDFKENATLFQEALNGAQRGISLIPVTAAYESTSGKIPVEHIGGQWFIALPEKQFFALLYMGWRKALDLTFGLVGLLVLGLCLLILAPLIYLDSPGPIFFSQERTGYRGRTFKILKLRTMRLGAERAENGAWTSKNDSRVTRIGRVLRATHLDELPQALNIARGEMSLIGPRPERPEYNAELAKESPFYSYRLSVKPGLTGWAQVKYGYGDGEKEELVKLQYDLFYIKHQSFLLDVLIILKTIGEVVLFHGV